MNFIPRLLMSLILCSLCLVVGCDSSKSLPEANRWQNDVPRYGGTLLIGTESRSDMLDPHIARGWVTYRVLFQIYEQLVKPEYIIEKGKTKVSVAPCLAKSWKVSPDGKIFTFYLRDDVRFHDGTFFDAQAVKTNVERVFDRDSPYFNSKAAEIACYLWKDLELVEVVDRLTVRFKFTQPFFEFPSVLVQGGLGSAGIISPTALEKWGNERIGEHPVGTGPFKLVEISEKKVVLIQNQEYWGTQPYLNKVVFWSIPEPAARVNALQAGDVDMIFAPSPRSIKDLEEEGFIVAKTTKAHVWYLSLNTDNPVFADIRVRRAMAMAINKNGLAQDLLENTARPAHGLIPPTNLSFDPDYKSPAYDIASAKALLVEAGYPDGFDLVLHTSVSGSGQILPVSIAKSIQRDLQKVNINVKIRTYEWIDYIDQWRNGIGPEVGMNQMSWGMTADYWIDIIVNSDNSSPRGYNTNRYCNPQVDSLLDTARAEPNPKARAELYRRANELVMADLWHIPIVNDLAPIIMNQKVKGFVHAPQEWYEMKHLWLSE